MSETSPAGEQIAEMELLLPGWQALALEQLAADLGLTSAQLIQRAVADFLTRKKLAPKPGELTAAISKRSRTSFESLSKC